MVYPQFGQDPLHESSNGQSPARAWDFKSPELHGRHTSLSKSATHAAPLHHSELNGLIAPNALANTLSHTQHVNCQGCLDGHLGAGSGRLGHCILRPCCYPEFCEWRGQYHFGHHLGSDRHILVEHIPDVAASPGRTGRRCQCQIVACAQLLCHVMPCADAHSPMTTITLRPLPTVLCTHSARRCASGLPAARALPTRAHPGIHHTGV